MGDGFSDGSFCVVFPCKSLSYEIMKSLSKKEESLQLQIPASSKKELQLKAAQDGVTVRVVVLRALEAYGIAIPESELIDREK